MPRVPEDLMKFLRLAPILVVTALPAFAAQTGTTTTPSTPPSQTTPPKLLTLTGCIQPGAEEDQFNLWDSSPSRKDKPAYRLSGGMDLKFFAGQKVRVVGGLLPSTNVAAQAGALDPAQSSMVSVGGVNAGGSVTAPAGATLPEFRVKTVKRLTGTCPPQ
jgi:hypothetical protein